MLEVEEDDNEKGGKERVRAKVAIEKGDDGDDSGNEVGEKGESKSMENENGGMMEENCKKDVFMWGVMEGHDSGGLRNKDKPAEVIEAIKKDIHIPMMCTIAQRFE